MSHLEKQKFDAISSLKMLCSRCREGKEHHCPIRDLAIRIKSLRGVPIIVNDKLHHVMFI